MIKQQSRYAEKQGAKAQSRQLAEGLAEALEDGPSGRKIAKVVEKGLALSDDPDNDEDADSVDDESSPALDAAAGGEAASDRSLGASRTAAPGLQGRAFEGADGLSPPSMGRLLLLDAATVMNWAVVSGWVNKQGR